MRPVATRQPAGDWGMALHPVGNLSLSFDHRAFDGAYAAAFLAAVRAQLETRDWAEEL
jgi:2-oxoglutarate dehydrogenase E2 component (dihydrolipoamide succinyltransferase)